jgi:hypothetical protein
LPARNPPEQSLRMASVGRPDHDSGSSDVDIVSLRTTGAELANI